MPDINITTSLPWKTARPGICVTLINMHGDAEAFTLHTAQFPLTADGREDAAQHMRVLELLPGVTGRGDPVSIEKVAEAIAKRLQLAPPAVISLKRRLVDLVRSDCTDDDSAASPVAYFVEMCDAHGVMSRAQFPDIDGSGEMVGFRQLSTTVAPCYFSAWE